MNDLVETLTRMGIEPVGNSESGPPARRFTEHRTVQPAVVAATSTPLEELGEIDLSSLEDSGRIAEPPAAGGIGLGDKVVLVFSDDQKRISARLLEGGNDLAKGRLAIVSPLGKAIIGAEEGDDAITTTG